jgi:hypothetical protein
MSQFNFRKIAVLIPVVFFATNLFAQDNNMLLKEAQKLELKFDEPAALDKYKQLAEADPSNISALVKCAELNCSIGERQKDKKTKAAFFQTASEYAQKAYSINASNADACYAMALAAGKMSETEDDNKKLIEDIKQIKIYSDKALAINPNHVKANYILGKWHFNLISEGWLKRTAIKNFYEGIPDTQVDTAAFYMEKSKSIDPYFALDYLELAKVYQYDHQPGKAVDVLNKLVRLPNRSFDDAAIKEEGKQMLAAMQ